ncbi:hypothetical protein HNR21_005836 [Actinomadura cellulosilytica]|uniref:Uncharacterized protein n=1 Tax=Thermomonospora cellulosilytica TaxID=1411118 RepID=A0A7W3N3P0_9ACTN|nr:hypothetical protein [Thermomonospora cellulosilytica]
MARVAGLWLSVVRVAGRHTVPVPVDGSGSGA